MPVVEPPVIKSPIIPEGREQDYRETNGVSAETDIGAFVKRHVDGKNMCINPWSITDPREDRDAEVSNPDGLIEEAYKLNPIVFLQHSHKVSPMTPPIGTARDKDDKYNVFRDGDTWYSGLKFSQATKFAAQVFALVAEGTLVGRSIGALNHQLKPYTPKAPGQAFHRGQIVPVRTKSVEHALYELIEWSMVWVPSHRHMVVSLKSFLSRDAIDGQQLDYTLRDVIKSFDLDETLVVPVQLNRDDEHAATDLWTKSFTPLKDWS